MEREGGREGGMEEKYTKAGLHIVSLSLVLS